MKQEQRTVRYDGELHLEAYRFTGINQPFPNHFHDYYVIGFVESGERRLTCKNKDYAIGPGDMLLFNPGDNHGCTQSDGGVLDYRGLNLSRDAMLSLAEEITGRRTLPAFSPPVLQNPELTRCLRRLHGQIMEGSREFEREELLLLLLTQLIQQYSQPFSAALPECGGAVRRACAWMEAHFSEPIRLDQLCQCSGLSKSTLLRAFTRDKGVTPYRYLQALRIGRAKELLEQGVPPAEAALRTGFADQSHFSNAFHRFIGLSPAAYRRIFQEDPSNDHDP